MSEKTLQVDQQTLLKYQAFIKELCDLVLTKDLKTIQQDLDFHLKNQPLEKIDNNKEDKTQTEKLTIKVLLNEIKEGNGKTVMHFAAQRGDLEIFQYLIEQGGDYNQKDSDGNTCFLHAIQQNHLQLIDYLITEKKVNINEERPGQIMGIHLASSNDINGDIIRYLIKNGANVEAVSVELGTPLTWAVAAQNINGIKILLDEGMCNVFGEANSKLPPPIIIAIDQENYQIVEMLINKNKGCLDQKDHLGYKCIHVASEKGNAKILKFLVDAGASVNEKCNGKEPIKLAMEHEQWECAALLRNLTAPNILEEIKQEQNTKQNEVIVDKYADLSQEEKEKKAIDLKLQGNDKFEQKNYVEAIPFYIESIKLNPKLLASYTNIAACFIQNNQPAPALEYCQKARKADEKWTKTYFREGEAYMQMGEFGDAAASFWEGYRLDSTNKALYQGFQKAAKLGKEKAAKEREEKKQKE